VATLGLICVVIGGGSAQGSSYTIVAGGAPVTVTTTVANENATLMFSGTAGHRISLKLAGVTIGTSTTASLKLSITKPDGTALVAATSFGTNGGFIDTKTLPTTGTYTILVDPQSSSIGSATLQLYDVLADPTTSISPGGAAVTVTTTIPGQNAKLTFAGTANRRVSLKLTGVTIGTSTTASLKISVTKPDGTALVTATSLGTNGGFIDTKTLATTGTYTILVDPQSSSIGSATVTLYDVLPDPTTSISPGGAAVTVTTTIPGQNAKLTFAGTAGQRISLKVSGVTIGTSTTASVKISITRPDGSALIGATTLGTNGAYFDVKSLSLTGTYTILVDPQGTATGSATLQLYDVPADAITPVTAGGAPVTVTTTVPGQNAKLTFAGTAGRGIALRLSGVTIGPSTTSSLKLSVTKPDGSSLIAPTLYGTNGTFIDTLTLPVTGTYTIVIDPQAASVGAATVQLYDVAPEGSASIAPGGPPVSVTLGLYQNGRVTFVGTAGEKVSLAIGFLPSACCTVNVSILNPNGTRLVNPIAVASGQTLVDAKTLPATGTYTIIVDPNQTATGTVTLTLFDVPPDVTGTMTLGGPAISLTTTAAGQNALALFTGTAGDGVIIRTGPGNCCSTSVSVLKPDGTTLVSPVAFTTAGGTLYAKLTVSGTYSVLIDYQGTALGTVSVSATLDNAPPSTPVLTLSESIPDAFVQGTTVFYRPAAATGMFNVTATATDGGSGIQKFTFPALSAGFTPTAVTTDTIAPYALNYSWTAGATLSSATNTVTVYDKVGNTSTATFTVRPDSTAPTTTDNTAAIGNAWKNTNQTVALTRSDGTGSGVAATYYTTNGSTPTTTSQSGTSVSLTSDGTYTISYFSVDNVTNTEAVKTGSTQIRIDKTAPTVTMTAPPAVIHNGQALTATASDAVSGIASVTYLYCAGTACTPSTPIGTSSTGPSYSITWSAQPADGPYQLLARATDVAGNTADSAKRSVTVDNTAPLAANLTATPANPTNQTSASFSFTGESGATFQCTLDGAAFAVCTSPKAYSGLADGGHTFQVRQTDAAGNTGPAASRTWTVDATSPVAPTITAGPSGTTNQTSASFSFTGEAGASFECQLDGGGFSACTSPKAYSGLADGSHTFQVRQTDTAGNTGPAASRNWTVDTVPPNTTIDASPADPSPADVSFSFSSPDGGTSFRCQLDGAGFTSCTSPTSFAGLSSGSHTFDVEATDAAGNADPTPASFTWTVS
jgi:uncharacterized protein YfaP (DUF2135 family)